MTEGVEAGIAGPGIVVTDTHMHRQTDMQTQLTAIPPLRVNDYFLYISCFAP